jgi:hypothetical protein
MQKHTSHHAGWKYTVSALALSVAMAPVAQAASVLQSTGKLELMGPITRENGPATRTALDTSLELVATKTKVLAGREFTFEKWSDAKGNVTSVILDAKGNEVSESALPEIAQVILQPELEALLRTRSGRRGLHKVNMALKLALPVPSEPAQTGTVETSASGWSQLQINGRTVSEKDFARLQAAEQKARRAAVIERSAERAQLLEAFAKRHNIDLPKEALESSTNTLTLELWAEQIEDLVDSKDPSILGIELYERDVDGLATAMSATAIDPYALGASTEEGADIGIYMTENNCPVDGTFGDYTRLAGGEGAHPTVVGKITKGVAPENYLYCRGGATLPTPSDLTDLEPAIQVLTRSSGHNFTTTYNTADRDWDQFIYDEEIPAFVLAHNDGNNTYAPFDVIGGISSPAKGLNVVTVGAYDDNATVTSSDDTIASFSSWVDPETGNNKPEVTAPGVNYTIDGVDEGSGTSWATPHAAAFTADSLSSYSWLQYKAHLAKAKQLGGATDPIAGDATGITMWEIPDKTGVGGIDFLSGHYDGWNYWMHGGNSDFSSLDADDGSPDGYITREVFISSAHDAVRIAMSWLTRGDYVYDNKDDAHPIGMDLDLNVYDPAGNLVGRSWSYDNGFEVVDFPPTTSGTYTFKINRWSNNDTANKIRLGVVVNFYNY